MALTNTRTSFGSVTKVLHWLLALAVIAMIPLGLVANRMSHEILTAATFPPEAFVQRAFLLFSLHKTLGIVIFFTALVRIAWAATQPRPALLNGDRRAEAFLARTTHILLYGSLILVPLTGWIEHAATPGLAPIRWPLGQSLPFVTPTPETAALFSGLHRVLERVLVLAILLHTAGALKHHFVDKDATLRRMLAGHIAAEPSTEQPHGPAPAIAALAIWAAALALGALAGIYSPA